MPLQNWHANRLISTLTVWLHCVYGTVCKYSVKKMLGIKIRKNKKEMTNLYIAAFGTYTSSYV